MITIYGELHSSKNGKSIVNINGRPMLISKKVVRDSEKGLLTQMILNRYKFIEEAKNLSKPIKIVFKIYRQTKRRFDYVNIVQQFCDCMVKAGWIPDDNADEIIPVFLPYEIDKNNPRVEVEVKDGTC